jgi:hypothetical protein
MDIRILEQRRALLEELELERERRIAAAVASGDAIHLTAQVVTDGRTVDEAQVEAAQAAALTAHLQAHPTDDGKWVAYSVRHFITGVPRQPGSWPTGNPQEELKAEVVEPVHDHRPREPIADIERIKIHYR